MTITAYKISPDYLKSKLAELRAQKGGGDLLPVFVEQTRKVLTHSKESYLRYGPYWWAVKRILHANGVEVGTYDEPIWANEYAVMNDDGTVSPELTLLSAWEFGDDNMAGFGVQSNEYELDDTTFLLYDPDQAARGQ